MSHNTDLRQRNTFALLVGVGDYSHPRFASLPATVRDVQAVATILTDPDRCGYPRDHVQAITGPDATAAHIRAALASLVQSTNSQSTVFLYFSGHGGRALGNGQWRTYLCPREADPDDLAHTAISGDEFSGVLVTVPARRLLVILDACHAAGSAELKTADGTVVWKAGLSDAYYEALSQGTGRVVIASSKEGQFSYVRPQGDLSLFTHHLLQALSGRAAVRGDGLIHVLDVFHYVNEAVQADEPRQTPILKVNDLDLNFPIALDQGGKGIGPAPAVAGVGAVREQIVYDPIAGARALSDYLATRTERTARRDEVDLKRAELERIQHDLDLFGPNPSDQAARNRAVYFLLRVCLELEQPDVMVGTGPPSSVQAMDDSRQNAIWQQRLRDLADNIAQALDLLKQYEDSLLYEDDPRRRARYLRQVKQLHELAVHYRREYDELRTQVIGEPLAAMQDLAAQLNQVSARLNTLCTESDLQPSTVTHSEAPQTEALPQIATNTSLTDQERTLLQHVHRNCRQVLVEKEFGGGYSGTRVLLTLPIAADGRRTARKVTKLGAAIELRTELDKYERYVGPNLPFCVARVEGERYYEHSDQAGLNYVFVGGGALGKTVTLEEYYRSAVPDAVERVVETLGELLDRNLGTSWYGQWVPLACFFAAEYGRHLVEHLRLRLRPASSDGLWPAKQMPRPPAKATGYQQVSVNAILHEHGRIGPGTLVSIEELLVTRIKHGLVTLEDPGGQGIVVRVDCPSEADTVQGLELGSVVAVRGEVVYNRHARMEEIIRTIFPDLSPGLDSKFIQLPCEPEAHPSPLYPNPLWVYPEMLGRTLEGRKSYVHGDLNLRNVLVDENGRGWLIDFAMVEERHNLFDFIKLETYVRLAELGRGEFGFSLCEYLRFEEALAGATLGKSMAPPDDPHLRFAHEVILAIRRIARKYMGPEPDFRNEYFPALLLYCLAATKYYRNDGIQAARLAFATACAQGRYVLGLEDQAGLVAPWSPCPHTGKSKASVSESEDVCGVGREKQERQPGSSQVPVTDVDSFDIAAIRRQLTVVFDDPSLETFCMDHFPQVYDKFSRGMRKDEKITLLLDHCRRTPARQQRLLAALKRKTE